MRAIILLFCIIMHIHIDGMKRLCTFTNTHPTKKFYRLRKNQYVPTDILCEILKACAYNEGKLKTIVKTIRAFGLVNKELYSYYNNIVVFNELLDIISKTHYCSHESITKFFYPPIAREQLALQRELKLLLSQKEPFREIHEKIIGLLQKGVRLNFTYNDKCQLRTPLMMAKSNKIIKLLLDNGSDINERTPQGTTALMNATRFPITEKHVKRIIGNPCVNINQTNNRGETALGGCIRNREKHDISYIFVRTIKALLASGADPLLADRNGYTPLLRAKKLGTPEDTKNEILKMIDDAITKKNQELSTIFI